MAKINEALQLLGELTNSEKAVIAECLHLDSSSSKNVSSESFMVSGSFSGKYLLCLMWEHQYH